MLLFQGLLEHARSSPWPERRNVTIQLQPDLALTLDIPNFGVVASTDETETRSTLTRVVLAHASFKAAIQPAAALDESFYKRCVAEVNAISLFFPDVKDDAIRVVFAAWLAFACVMDDILEILSDSERELVLLESIQILWPAADHTPTGIHGFMNPITPTSKASDQRIQAMTRTLLEHTTRYLPPRSAPAFFAALCNVLDAHYAEVHFLRSPPPTSTSLAAYLALRRRTISLNPFFEVLKANLLDPQTYNHTPALHEAWLALQTEVSQAAGLQNDLIGLPRDLEDGEPLNAVVVLMRACRGYDNATSHDATKLDRALLQRCTAVVNAEHNAAVARAMDCAHRLHRAVEEAVGYPGSGASNAIAKVEEVARHVLGMCETHLRWCAGAKRYRLEVGVDAAGPVLTPGSSPELGPANVLPEHVPAAVETAAVGNGVVVLRNQGLLHGLPTYPEAPEKSGLTAIVTGATGLSGYSMVKALASAPHRWSKIYCLSSRTPPESFFAELGEGAARVEHIPVDFLGNPAEIAQTLTQKISHVDHIFYFSYMHLPPKGNVLDLWSNADELAAVNVTLFTNFLSALQLSTLYPRRFILQTGTKHYAFYLGPASIPAFESDPRVLSPGDRNFYYEQEDLLTTFCTNSPGNLTTYAVSRPNYIIGSPASHSGGALNHLLGIAVYAAVQARLGEKLAFPGGYDAWEREQVQSSAVLNAVFSEWLALAEGIPPNEAWNVHDGLGFTWGRLWPCIAKWFGLEWTPPEGEEGRYRVLKMPGGGESTPRGYGPQMTFRSTFTLLEWSQQPHVEAAWHELAAEHGLVLNPFDDTDARRARVFAFSDSAVVGDVPMTTSLRKAREHGFFGTVDSFRTVFEAIKDMARLKLVPPMVAEEYVE
ncbi:hypothetical protein VTJ49DRAFT_488 [Mycothermus thermophilus]|uniref:PRISE-like Rossmann-fold domain-containing protein n=1 Tax=Humicola insolens TaxID=85995 RepID=A0ABR3VEY2_HUMIN